jgi:hypothetical protein
VTSNFSASLNKLNKGPTFPLGLYKIGRLWLRAPTLNDRQQPSAHQPSRTETVFLHSFTKQPVLSGNHFSTTTRLWPIRCSLSLLSAASSLWYVLSSSFPTLFDTCPAPKPCISHFVYPQTVPPRPPPTVVGLIAYTIPANLPYSNTMLTILTDQWSHGSRRWP